MGSMYDLCPKCGAVAKNGKCTSCGRLVLKSSNSTMDKWRRESRQWQNYNKNAHQDHCEDHGGDGNVYLNGKVIRTTSNYRDYDYASGNYESSQYESAQDDILSYSRQGASSYNAAPSKSAEESASVLATAPVVNTANFPLPRTKKKKKVSAFWIILIIIVVGSEIISEEDWDFDDITYAVEDFFDSFKSKDNNEYYEEAIYTQPDESEATSEYTYNDFSNVEAQPYDGNLFNLYMNDPLCCKWVDPTAASPQEYIGDKEEYSLCDVISSDAGYEIHWGSFFYNNTEGYYDIEGADIPYPKNVVIYTRFPVIQYSALDRDTENSLNDFIYTRSAECVDAFDWFNVDDEEEKFNINSYAYVTYMDKYKMSVVFMDYYYISQDFNMDNSTYWGSRISSFTFNMRSGEVIDVVSSLKIPDNFGELFVETFEKQAGQPLSSFTAQDISDEVAAGNFVAYYTPIGLEAGICKYDYGAWATCSFTDPDSIFK